MCRWVVGELEGENNVWQGVCASGSGERGKR